MQRMESSYLSGSILKSCDEVKDVYKKINSMIREFEGDDKENNTPHESSDVNHSNITRNEKWDKREIACILSTLLSENEYVYELLAGVSEMQKRLILTNACILQCRLFVLLNYSDIPEGEKQELFDGVMNALQVQSSLESASSRYLLELILLIFSSSDLLKCVGEHKVLQLVQSLITLDTDFTSASLLASIIQAILANFTDNLNLFFEVLLPLYTMNGQKDNTNPLSQSLTKALTLSDSRIILEQIMQFTLSLLTKGHRILEDTTLLNFVFQIHKISHIHTQPIIFFLNDILNNKKQIKHAISQVSHIYQLYGKIISSKNSQEFNTDMFQHFLNGIALPNMASHRIELVRLSIKFIKRNQNYNMLKKAPLQMQPEKFRLSNAVIKMESSILSLLANDSITLEEKKKIVDLLHVNTSKSYYPSNFQIHKDVSIQKSDIFSQFFYEEFLHIFKSVGSKDESKDEELREYCKKSLSNMYYFVVGRIFCEDEIFDLRCFDDRLSCLLQQGLERANNLHTLVLKCLFQDTLALTKQHLYPLMDLLLNIMYPSTITKYSPLKALVGFIFNSYETFYQDDYFDIKTSNNSLSLSDSQKYDQFVFKNIGKIDFMSSSIFHELYVGAHWSLDLDVYPKKSFLIWKGITRIVKVMVKSCEIFQDIIHSDEFDEQRAFTFFRKYYRKIATNIGFKIESFFSALRTNRDIIRNIIKTSQFDDPQEQTKQSSEIPQPQQQTGPFSVKHGIIQRLINVDRQSLSGGDQFFQVVFCSDFTSAQNIRALFQESCKSYKEGNISLQESLIWFLIILAKASIKQRSRMFSLTTSLIVDFFIAEFDNIKNLTSKYPGKVNLKARQLKLDDHFIHLLSLLDIQIDFPQKRDPEDFSERLRREIQSRVMTPVQIKRTVRILNQLDCISSNKVIPRLVNNAILNISEHPSDIYLNSSLIYYALKLHERTAADAIISLDKVSQVLKQNLHLPNVWSTSSMISPHSLNIRLLIKTALISHAHSFDQIVNLTLLLATLLANPKQFSPNIKTPDVNHFKLTATQSILTLLQREPTLISYVLPILSTQIHHFDSVITRGVFHIVAKRIKELPQSMIGVIHLYLVQGDEHLQMLSRTLLRSLSERQQQIYFAQEEGMRDISNSLQYSIVYLLYIYMNVPRYLHGTESEWKRIIASLSESIEVLVINKSLQFESLQLLASIIARLKSAAIPANLPFKLSNELLNQRVLLTQTGSLVPRAEKFWLLCEVALDIITQKWISINKSSSLHIQKVNFALSANLYELTPQNQTPLIHHHSSTTNVSQNTLQTKNEEVPSKIKAVNSQVMSQNNINDKGKKVRLKKLKGIGNPEN